MFQGFMLISDETGKCEEVFYYTGGERFEMHIADYTTEEKMNNRHLQMSVGFSVMEAMITTKGENVRAYEKGDKYYCYKCHSFANFEDGVCSKCGSSPLEIGGGEAYFFCKGCGKLVRSCICNPKELRPRTSEPDLFEERCDWCGSRHCNGECRRTRKGKGGGDKPQLPTPEQLRDLCTVTIAKPVGGTVMGAGIYKRGSTAIISASPASGYVFAGWNEFLETPVQGLQTVEGWFGSFVRFNNKYQLGLNIYLYKTDDNGRVPSKRIYNVLDIIDFVNRINVCN